MAGRSLVNGLLGAIKRGTEPEYYFDMFDAIRNFEGEDFDFCHQKNKELRKHVVKRMKSGRDVEKMFELYRRTLLFDAKWDFDSYLQYLEIDRDPHERFYLPRREVLRPLAMDLQDLADNKLDELFLSEPPRVGKTTMLLFYVTWLIGRDSEKSNLYSAYSDMITRAFYNGVLEIINDPDTYLWHDVFPNSRIVQTNAQDETLNLDRRTRYPSLTCRSLYGTLNGACDCNGVLISDDLIGGIEEALNPDRMVNAWSKVDNNLLPRAKESAKILWCGTRWSNIDPAGLRMELLQNDSRFKERRVRIRNVPALNEKDESNFEYKYGVGFSTDYYRQRRASFERNNDMASWQAQYMGEPIERQGTLYEPDGMRYFIDLPLGEPDRVVMAVDPAYGGGDYTASPICAVYGEEIYVLDTIYDNGDKTVTQRLICEAVEKYGVTAIQIEATKATEGYAVELKKALYDRGIRLNLTTKPAPTNKSKEARILDKAPEVRENFLFKQSGMRGKPYDLFMQNVFSFKVVGKNKHDDAPDSLCMAVDMVFGRGGKGEAFRRWF